MTQHAPSTELVAPETPAKQSPAPTVDQDLVNATALPELPPEARQQLKHRIQAEGATEPLIVWSERNIIIDGAIRHSIYAELSITDYPVVAVSLEDEQAAKRYRIERNLVRRHLNRWERCRIVYEAFFSEIRETKQPNGSGDKYTQAAKLAHVSRDTFNNVVKILENIETMYGSEDDRNQCLNDLKNEEITISRCVKDNNFKNRRKSKKNKKTRSDKPNGKKTRGKEKNDDNELDDLEYENRIIDDYWQDRIKIIDPDSVTLSVFSPPYLGAGFEYHDTWNDEASYETYLEDFKLLGEELYRITRPGGMIAININEMLSKQNEREQFERYPFLSDVNKIFRDAGLTYIRTITWIKTNYRFHPSNAFKPGKYKFSDTTEFIMLFSKGPQGIDYSDDDVDQEFYSRSKKLKNMLKSDWQIPTLRRRTGDLSTGEKHECPFPYQIPYRLVRLFSFKNDLIFDPFCGTGTTCRAAKDLDRRWCGIDADTLAVESAQGRLEDAYSPELDKAIEFEDTQAK